MSQLLLRQALEERLAALTPNLATAYENVAFTPVNGTPYQKVNLLPANPDNSTIGGSYYREQGLLQVTLYYPLATGALAAYTQAELIKAWFQRGTGLQKGAVNVRITKTPAIAPPFQSADRYALPISIYYQADIYT